MDAYNANPTSMKASIESFSNNKLENKYLILGDMLELGEYSEQEHRLVLQLLEKKGFKNVYLVGKEFQNVAGSFTFDTFQHVNELCAHLQRNKIKKGNILIKGSRGIQLEKILDVLN